MKARTAHVTAAKLLIILILLVNVLYFFPDSPTGVRMSLRNGQSFHLGFGSKVFYQIRFERSNGEPLIDMDSHPIIATDGIKTVNIFAVGKHDLIFRKDTLVGIRLTAKNVEKLGLSGEDIAFHLPDGLDVFLDKSSGGGPLRRAVNRIFSPDYFFTEANGNKKIRF